MREPVVIVGGFLSSPGDYSDLVERLSKPPYDRKAFVVNVGRLQWVTTNNDKFEAQFNGLEKAVEEARRSTGAEKIWLIGHSAGGRVSRLWIGEKPYGSSSCGGHKYVRGLICLGTPYTTEEPWAVNSATFANENYPGAFYPDLTYLSVIGRAVYGNQKGSIEQRLAYQSYKVQVPKNPCQWGDGVVTVDGAYMQGAENHILEGVHHVGLFGRKDYANSAVMKTWAYPLAEA